MIDPVQTLYLISKVTPRVFIWTHYIGPDFPIQATPVTRYGYACDYYEVFYDDSSHSRG